MFRFSDVSQWSTLQQGCWTIDLTADHTEKIQTPPDKMSFSAARQSLQAEKGRPVEPPSIATSTLLTAHNMCDNYQQARQQTQTCTHEQTSHTGVWCCSIKTAVKCSLSVFITCWCQAYLRRYSSQTWVCVGTCVFIWSHPSVWQRFPPFLFFPFCFCSHYIFQIRLKLTIPVQITRALLVFWVWQL